MGFAPCLTVSTSHGHDAMAADHATRVDEEIASLGMGAIKFDPWSEWASELGQFRDLMGSLRVRVQNRELASAFQELVLN